MARIVPIIIAFAVLYEAGRPLWQPHMQEIGINIASFGIIFAVIKLAALLGSVAARHQVLSTKGMTVIFVVMLLSLLAFGASIKVVSITALCMYMFTENYFRIYMSTTLNALIHTNRAAILSFSSVIRNLTGALIIAGASILSSVSIFAALFAIVLIKIPAIVYILSQQRRTA